MKKVFKIKNENEEVVGTITNEDIASAWAEGVDSTLEDIANDLFPDEEGIGDWDSVTDIVEGNESTDSTYNQWFDEGILDDAATATMLDRIFVAHEDYGIPVYLYKGDKKIYTLDEDEAKEFTGEE